MTVGFMRWLQRGDTIQTAGGIAVTMGDDVVAPLRCKQFNPIALNSPLRRRKTGKHRQMIIETTRCVREYVPMR